MKYYSLQMIGCVQSWVKCDFDSSKKQIKLYNNINGTMKQYGIGLY